MKISRMQIKEARILPFLVSGGIAALFNFGSRLVLNLFMPYEIAIVIAYLIGMLVAFILMRGKVFQQRKGKIVPQVLKFIFVNILSIFQTLLVSLGLVHLLFPFIGFSWHNEALAHLIGILVPVIVSYFLHRNLTFKQSGAPHGEGN